MDNDIKQLYYDELFKIKLAEVYHGEDMAAEEYSMLVEATKLRTTDIINKLSRDGFFDAPASTQYHFCFDGGLSQFDLHVLSAMRKLNKFLGFKLEDESLIKVALLHEVAKKDMYKKYVKNEKHYIPEQAISEGIKLNYDELGNFQWASSIKYCVSDDYVTDGNTGFDSYLYAKLLGFNFTKEEITAICNYNYITNKNEAVRINDVLSHNPLLLVLHLARMTEMYCPESSREEYIEYLPSEELPEYERDAIASMIGNN